MGKRITLDCTLKDVYDNPVGHDAIEKLLDQLGIEDRIFQNPILRKMKLRFIIPLLKPVVGLEFFKALFHLLNSEKDTPKEDDGEVTEAWWKEAVFYQIYPRSFMDSNGDGIGDLAGIIEKLDYLKSLGIDALWLSPIYDSPNDDNGYDIRDYYKIMQEFGSMEDFERLLSEVHARGMRLIMDLVVNHTSDEHQWFQEALTNRDSKYRDYYFFREADSQNPDEPPNNWLSFFSGSAWNRYDINTTNQSNSCKSISEEVCEDQKESSINLNQYEWALHLFSKKQMDLNWDNPDVRQDIISMIRWWLGKGVDGFRMDVINYISKVEGLPDGDEMIYKIMGYRGIENYYYGPNLHTYLHQIKTEAFEPYDAFSVGETPGVGMEMAKLLTGEYRRELDMVFSFDHLETPGHVRFDDYQYDLNYWKKYVIHWTKHYPSYCWPSLFYDNHDNPRFVSKVSKDPKYRARIAKLLAVIQLTSRGTPFIFQGQEIGMVNNAFTDMEQLRDVESINKFDELIEEGRSASEAWNIILAGTRDHARTPMQWSNEEYGGFTTGRPWIHGDQDYLICNVERAEKNPHSVLNFYKQLIQLRKQNRCLVYGEITFVHENRKDYFAYTKAEGERVFFVECNLGTKVTLKPKQGQAYRLLLSNYAMEADILRPYEANVYEAY